MFVVKSINNDFVVDPKGVPNTKYMLHKLCDFPTYHIALATLISMTNDRNTIWHERLGHP